MKGLCDLSKILSFYLDDNSLVCDFCHEEQPSSKALETHTLSVHGELGNQNDKGNLESIFKKAFFKEKFVRKIRPSLNKSALARKLENMLYCYF